MLVLHMSYTPLAGAPIRLVNTINKYTTFNARLINFNPYIYENRVFEEDLIWEKDKEEALELLSKADIIHFHHWMELDNNGFNIDFNRIVKNNCKFIRMFHSNINFISHNNENKRNTIINDNIPKLVIPHSPERSFLNAIVVPNIVPINDEDYKPLNMNNEKPIIFYSYTYNNYGFSSRWDTKGYPEVSELLNEFKDISYIQKITNTPFFECLKLKRQSDIVIDDIITGSYHLTSLEALSQGKPVLSYLDNRTQYILRELTGAEELPFVNVKVEEAKYVLKELCENKKLRDEIGAYSRKWMEKYYNDKDLIKIYVQVYEDLLNGKNISREKPSDERKWLSVDIEDLIWKARKDNYNIISDYQNLEQKLEEQKLKSNWFTLFGISNNKEYIRIILFGIKLTLKINKSIISKISWWIPIKKLRENFRNKFN